MSQPIHDVMKEIMSEAEPDQHIGIADLADYQDQLLPVAQTQRVRAHLTVCPKCTQSLLQLHDLAGGQLEATSLQQEPAARGRLIRFLTRADLAWACAAVLVLALVFQGERNEPVRGETELAIIELFPLDAVTKSTGDEGSVLDEGLRELVLVLHPEMALEQEDYLVRLEFANTKNHHLRLTPAADGTFRFSWRSISGGGFPHRLVVLDDQGRQVAEFATGASR